MSVPASSLSLIPRISQLSSRVVRVLGCNPGPMTLQGTNTYVVGTGEKRILIDTGDGQKQEYFTNLKSALDEHGANLSSVLLTHWHGDHVGGVDTVVTDIAQPDAPILKYPRSDSAEPPLPPGRSYRMLEDGEELKVEGATLEVVHTPGHTTDHFVLHLKEENALFSGDCILGEGTAVFEDLHDYMRSLDKILRIRPKVIYPAHGKVIEDPVPKIEYYISHRNEREKQIFQTLKDASGSPLTAMDIVKKVYKETPSTLYPAAAVNVSHHLKKLCKEGKIEEAEGGGEAAYKVTK